MVTRIDTYDVIAIQRFFVGRTFGIGNVGHYQFTPANRSYEGLVGGQVDQSYNGLVIGDVAFPFVE